MSALGGLVVTLNANIARFESAMNRANYLMHSSMKGMTGSVRGLQSSIDALPGSLLRVAATVGGLTTLSMVFKKGIDAVDDYRVAVVSIASTLSDMSKPGQGDMKEVFGRNKVYAEDMYRAITIEDAKHFATAKEMMTVYNRLVQGGYAVRLDEVAALGTLTDKIKLATKGQDAEKQLNTEIMALMEGKVKQGSMLAMELKSRIGPEWGNIVQKHKEAGDLLSFMAGLYPGLSIANKEIEATLESQGSSLKTQLELLAIAGLGGAYDDIVGYVKDINTYLRDHGKELAGNIATGWNVVKDVAGGVLTIVQGIYDWASWTISPLSSWVKYMKEAANLRPEMGAGLALDVMPGLGEGGIGFGGGNSKAIANEEYLTKTAMARNQKLADEAAKYKEQTYRLYLKDLGPTKVTPAAHGGGGKGGGAGKSIKDSTKDLEVFQKVMDSIYKSAEDNIKQIDTFLENIEKGQADYLDLQKGQFDQLAQLSPALQEQLGYKQQALDLENQINQATLEKKLMELEKAHIINKSIADEMRGRQALINQFKKYDAAWNKVEKHVHLFDNIFSNIGSGFANMITGIMQGTMTLTEGIAGLFNTIGNSFLNVIMTMLSNWTMAQVMMMGMNYAASVGIITNEAAVAGAKAYAAYADIPFIGLALGAAAAAAVMGIMLAFQGNLKSSAGGDYRVTENSLRVVHKDETILPVWAAESWRGMVEGKSNRGEPGENGRPTTVHVQMNNHFTTELTQAQCDRSVNKLLKAINNKIGNRAQRIG